MVSLTCSLLLLGIFSPLSGKQISLENVQRYILSLIENRSDVSKLFLESEIAASVRLGISYDGVENKFLIGDEIDSSVAAGIRNHSLSYDVHIDSSHDED